MLLSKILCEMELAVGLAEAKRLILRQLITVNDITATEDYDLIAGSYTICRGGRRPISKIMKVELI